MPRCWSRFVAGLVVWTAVLAGGCTEEIDEVQLTEVPAPEGGVVETVAITDSENGPEVVAPTRESLYMQGPDNGSWGAISVQWPDALSHTEGSPLAGMFWSRESFNFPTKHRLTAHAGRLWMLTRPTPAEPSALLVSDDAGHHWSRISLPSPYRSAPRRRARRSGDSRLSRIEPRAPLRIVSRGDDGLYLLGARGVWEASMADGALDSWRPVALSDPDVLGSATNTTLPKVVRNYLPATDQRPYELLTVFGDRLYVYRRHEGSGTWVLVSTLPTVDIGLRAAPDGQMLYLFAPEAIYRSGERGEQWEKVTIAGPLDEPPRQRAFAFVSGETIDRGGPTAGLLVGTEDGAIYRSLDGGDSWDRVRERDPDGRAITGLNVEDASGWIWASTAGQGVLRSTDGGTNWEATTRGMGASRPASMATGPNDELLIGTRAGLFRLTGAPEDGHWDRYHDRGTTAIKVTGKRSRILAGTLGGAIVTENPDGELDVSEAGTYKRQSAPLFQPWSSPPWISRPSAILSLQPRPASEQLFAWSRNEGMLASSDNGGSWRRHEFNPALRSALEQTVVSNFVVDRDSEMFLTSQPFELNVPAQLWHSPNDGSSWHTVYTFASSGTHQPLLVRRPDDAATSTLYMARGNQLARSTDGGKNWRDLEGPWQNGAIRAYATGDNRHTLLYNTPRATHVAFVTRLDSREPGVQTYTLSWPSTGTHPRANIRDVVAIDETLYVRTNDAVYAGSRPDGDTQLPHAPTIMATLVVILVITGLSFFYLRTTPAGYRAG